MTSVLNVDSVLNVESVKGYQHARHLGQRSFMSST